VQAAVYLSSMRDQRMLFSNMRMGWNLHAQGVQCGAVCQRSNSAGSCMHLLSMSDQQMLFSSTRMGWNLHFNR
jgi:hypothetical protein